MCVHVNVEVTGQLQASFLGAIHLIFEAALMSLGLADPTRLAGHQVP